jgi:hypothetical protein
MFHFTYPHEVRHLQVCWLRLTIIVNIQRPGEESGPLSGSRCLAFPRFELRFVGQERVQAFHEPKCERVNDCLAMNLAIVKNRDKLHAKHIPLVEGFGCQQADGLALLRQNINPTVVQMRVQVLESQPPGVGFFVKFLERTASLMHALRAIQDDRNVALP